MNELELQNALKMGLKSPSKDFTDKVMGDISVLPKEVPNYNKWKVWVLVIACCVLLILSVFIRIPEIEFFDQTIEFSPAVVPVITLFFLFLIFQQLCDLSSKLVEPSNKGMA